ncbi:MAG: hypothetical protein OHK0039_47050 [Bacteroidia bacterium]
MCTFVDIQEFDKQSNMNKIRFTLLALLAGGMAACTGPRYTASTEYDDVYYTSADRPAPVVTAEDNDVPGDDRYDTYSDSYAQPQERYREPVDNYREYYYSDDDFAFSRRIRRFSQNSNASWRYYDPYFSNDLYFVMGTPYWSRWNSMGWYNWNRPRFGAYMGFNDHFFNPMGFNAYYNVYNDFYNPFYYDPWVGAYYGYSPAFHNPYSAWNMGYYNGFNNGFYNGFYSPYYCPPTNFVPGSSWNRYNNTRAYVTRPRTSSTQSTLSQTSYSPRESMNNPRSGTSDINRVANTSNIDYTRPATRPTVRTTERVGTTTPTRPSTTTRQATQSTLNRNNQAPVYVSPGNSTSVNTNRPNTNATPSTRPSTTTRPSYDNNRVVPNNNSGNSTIRRTPTYQSTPTPRNNTPSNVPSGGSTPSFRNNNSGGSFNSSPSPSRTVAPSNNSAPRTSSGVRRP